jgi:hypothetical protein
MNSASSSLGAEASGSGAAGLLSGRRLAGLGKTGRLAATTSQPAHTQHDDAHAEIDSPK